MHYRFRGNNIQVVKSRLNSKNGKAKSVPLGSINRATLAISDKLRNNCSPEELAEIESWVKQYQGIDELKNKVAALTLPEQQKMYLHNGQPWTVTDDPYDFGPPRRPAPPPETAVRPPLMGTPARR